MNTFDIILAQFPGKTLIPITDAGAAIGYAGQTCYNLFHRGEFPMPVRKVGRKSMVSLIDLAKFMDAPTALYKEKATLESEQPRRRGRPTKAEQIRRNQ